MTTARECDLCGTLFKPQKGDVTLDVHVITGDNAVGTIYAHGWSDVDCCPECSAKVLAIIKPALDGFDEAHEREPEDRDGQ